jgi:hypothetical protein
VLFDTNVQPLLQARCAACHNAGSIAPPLWTTPTYDEVVANTSFVGGFDPSQAQIVTKGPHPGALWWNADEELLIIEWLNAEAAARQP